MKKTKSKPKPDAQLVRFVVTDHATGLVVIKYKVDK